MSSAIKPGDTCPSLTLPTTDSSDLRLPPANGRGLIVFFYPRDNTSGCTTEAQDFSTQKSVFAHNGYDIVGISRDSLESHRKFIDKQGLSVPLASDEDGKACEAFGVWVEKKMYGKTFMGIERSTFSISPEGKILQAWRKVRVKGHVEEVLANIEA